MGQTDHQAGRDGPRPQHHVRDCTMDHALPRKWLIYWISSNVLHLMIGFKKVNSDKVHCV